MEHKYTIPLDSGHFNFRTYSPVLCPLTAKCYVLYKLFILLDNMINVCRYESIHVFLYFC